MKIFLSLIPILCYSVESFHSQNHSSFYQITNETDTVSIDTVSMDGFQLYGQDKAKLTLGNLGSTRYNLVFDPEAIGSNHYTKMARSVSPDIITYHLDRPASYASYLLGSKQEQVFNVFHSQNLNARSNVLLGFDKIKSEGFYQNQATNNNHAYAHVRWAPRKENYHLDANFDYFRLFNELNGGITDDSLFGANDPDFRSKDLLDVNLLNASHTMKQNVFQFKHDLSLYNATDSNGKGNSIALFNQLHYTYQERSYRDSLLDLTFYNYINVDSSLSTDTLRYRQYRGNIGLFFNHKKKSTISTSIWGDVAYNQFKQYEIDTAVLDINIGAKIAWNQRRISLYGEGLYLINDQYIDNDYRINAKGVYQINRPFSVGANVEMRNDRPELDLLQYYANNISWNNTSFTKTKKLQTSAWALYTKSENRIRLGIGYTDIFNPIFFNASRVPQQVNGIAQVIQTSVSADWSVQKWRFRPHIAYQFQGGYKVYPVPDLYTNLTIEYNFSLFKKKMNLSTGTNITYYTAFEAPSFDPVSGQFYIAMNEPIGHYPFVDVFVKARIKQVNIYLASTHVNQGLLGYDYFLLSHYPANDRAFKIGLSWLFLN